MLIAPSDSAHGIVWKIEIEGIDLFVFLTFGTDLHKI